jgi:2-polyprenyl-3-methyl-5-hydroxy-6-metoxy-1,4-benzoquinol methylase
MNQSLPPTANADARFWDRTARKYALSPIEDMGGYERTLARTAALLRPTDRVLEVGCGTGTTALRLAAGAGRYDATDISPAMIEIANEKLAADPQPHLTFAAATAADISAPVGGWDVILAFNLLHLVDDLGQTLRQLHEQLRPGGILVAKTALVSELNMLIRAALPLMRLVGKAPPSVRVFDEGTLLTAMRDAGFVVESVERHGTKGGDVRLFTLARRPI